MIPSRPGCHTAQDRHYVHDRGSTAHNQGGCELRRKLEGETSSGGVVRRAEGAVKYEVSRRGGGNGGGAGREVKDLSCTILILVDEFIA